MRLSTQIAFLMLPVLILAHSAPAFASAPAPCIKAVSSKDGNFLVLTDRIERSVNDITFRQVSLRVFRKENFINEKDRVVSSETYWTDGPQWSVVLDSSEGHRVPACPVSLITDDGEFLIIVANDFISDSALRIFRRRDHLGDPLREGPDQGVFIRDIPLKELWPADKLSGIQVFTDASPKWFAGGTFEFSSDFRCLVHKTRWGNTVRINLLDGSVSTN